MTYAWRKIAANRTFTYGDTHVRGHRRDAGGKRKEYLTKLPAEVPGARGLRCWLDLIAGRTALVLPAAACALALAACGGSHTASRTASHAASSTASHGASITSCVIQVEDTSTHDGFNVRFEGPSAPSHCAQSLPGIERTLPADSITQPPVAHGRRVCLLFNGTVHARVRVRVYGPPAAPGTSIYGVGQRLGQKVVERAIAVAACGSLRQHGYTG